MIRAENIPLLMKVLLPVGCVLVLAVVVLGMKFIAFVENSIKSSEPYTHSVRVAKQSPKVSSILGPPIDEGSPGGELTYGDGPEGSASLSIPLNGIHEKGVLSVDATMEDGAWSYHSMGFRSESGVSIDLLSE